MSKLDSDHFIALVAFLKDGIILNIDGGSLEQKNLLNNIIQELKYLNDIQRVSALVKISENYFPSKLPCKYPQQDQVIKLINLKHFISRKIFNMQRGRQIKSTGKSNRQALKKACKDI